MPQLANPAPRLAMGQAGDRHERQARHAARAAVRPAVRAEPTGPQTDLLRRAPGPADAAPVPAPPAAHDGLATPAQPLESQVRQRLEAGFGQDFSQVRVHAGPRAAQAAHDLQARAYTVGNDLVFGAGQYAPGSAEGRELIAHELTHVLQQRGSAPLVQRALLLPDAKVTEPNDDPIARFMGNDNSIALTTLTVNGKTGVDRPMLARALRPTQVGVDAPTAPAKEPGAGSGSGAEAPAPRSCRFKDFDITVSANMRLPKAPAGGRWGPKQMDARTITRQGLPPECSGKDTISVVMKGQPDSASFHGWLLANEDQHLADYRRAAQTHLEPVRQATLALRGSGDNASACTADLYQQHSRMSSDPLDAFLSQVSAEIVQRDAPGGHKFDVKFTQRNRCDNLELNLKPTPPPSATAPRAGAAGAAGNGPARRPQR